MGGVIILLTRGMDERLTYGIPCVYVCLHVCVRVFVCVCVCVCPLRLIIDFFLVLLWRYLFEKDILYRAAAAEFLYDYRFLCWSSGEFPVRSLRKHRFWLL